MYLDAGSAAVSTSTLLPPQRSSVDPTAKIASVPQVHFALRPTAPLPTALDAFVVLQRAHQQQVSFAFLHSTFVAKSALSASTEAQAPMACVRENISSVFVWEFKIFYFYFFLFLFKLTIIFCTFFFF